ncbi:5'-3' exoribonuclease 1-like isoform X2 [Symsagittifera roscoffensis]|uniref:5'-3' exoribonuclease 1-like isoform X2 n=1 Tax=Symsagittifera roscoffensis TaxID=84072 RepID=UPI00307C31A3
MGIPKFYRWISERYPCLSEVINETQVPEFDCLYLDMNGIIHVCSHPSDDVHFRMSEKEMFVDICRYIEVLFRIISPKRTFLMAVDGVAPRAKMNQQRARRFKTAKDTQKKEKEAQAKGEVLPDEPPFDSNCITPGTEFMDRLQQHLKYFTAQKVSTDSKWQGVEIIMSGHDVPGEGEHKIMEFIRAQRSKPDYDSNTRHCMYGLDADLIMLGLCSHEPHFSLLREEVRFGKFAQQGKQNSRVSNADRTTFHLLHLSLLREYLEMEFKPIKEKLPFDFDVERIIDDWVLMGFLVGNDFLPHLPFLHINKNALSILHNTYMRILPTMDGYLNEDGALNLERFEIYCRALGEADREYFDDINADMQWMKSKRLGDAIEQHHQTHLSPTTTSTNSAATAVDKLASGTGGGERWLQQLEAGFLFDEDDDDAEGLEGDDDKKESDSKKVSIPKTSNVTELRSLFSHEFQSGTYDNEEGDEDGTRQDLSEDNLEYLHWKRVYYIEKFKIQNPDMDFIRQQVELYIRALQWNLHYYYNGVQSWSWFYSQHYAPFASDLRDFTDVDMSFDLAKPFNPYEQLLAVLPERSRNLLPDAYSHLMVKGPIVDFYPEEFEQDLNGKQMDWEAVVLVPFIDEHRLLDAMSQWTGRLKLDEKRRNARGSILVYRFDRSLDYEYPAVHHYDTMDHCKAKITEHPFNKWAISKQDVKHGLLEGVKLDVYFDGFPTTKHIEYTSELRAAGVKVFQGNSRSDNMIIKITPRDDLKCLDDATEKFFSSASEMMDNSAVDLKSVVFVKWPYLKEAKVVAVSDNDNRLSKGKDGEIVHQELAKKDKAKLRQEYQTIIDWYYEKRGVMLYERDVKPQSQNMLMVEVVELVGRKNVYHQQSGTVTLEPRYASNTEVYPIELCVHGIMTQSKKVEKVNNLDEMFPQGSTLFLIGSSYYGEEATVVECTPQGSVKFEFYQKVEPNFENIINKKDTWATMYFSQREVADRLRISPLLVGRITGSIFVLPPPEEKEKDDKNSDGKQGGGGLDQGWCVNIGLNLKFTRSNEEVMGYTKRVNNEDNLHHGGGGWLYSEKCMAVIQEYMDTFPDMFALLMKNPSADKFKAQNIFPQGCDAQQELDKLTKFLKGVSCAKAKKISCSSQILEEQVLTQIQTEIERCNIANYKSKRKMLAKGSPVNLFRPSDLNGSLMPDESTQFRMFDRVVNVRDGFCVPVGLRGTVIGLPSRKQAISRDAILDVLFDESFLGAHQVMPGTWFSAYRLPATSLINITHGHRQQRTTRKSTGEAKASEHQRTDARIMPKATATSEHHQYHTSRHNGLHQQQSGGSSSIRQLLDKASAAAVNEKMYQKSKNASSSANKFTPPTNNLPFDPYHAPNSTYHAGQSHSGSEPSPAFVNLTQQFMENMPQSQWSQQIYAQHQSIPMNKETSYDSSSDSDVPTFDFRHKSFSRRECGPGSIPTGSNMSESQWKQMHSKQSSAAPAAVHEYYSSVVGDLTDLDNASRQCAPFADLYEQHKMQQFSGQPNTAQVQIHSLHTGFACTLNLLGKSYDGPICATEVEALTEASTGMIKFLNSLVLSQNREAFQAYPGLYKPQQFYTPRHNGVPKLLNQNGSTYVQQQVLVPGQIDTTGSNVFMPSVLGPNMFNVSVNPNSNMLYNNQAHNQNQDQQNTPNFQSNAGPHVRDPNKKPHRRGNRTSAGRGRSLGQNCAMSFYG